MAYGGYELPFSCARIMNILCILASCSVCIIYIRHSPITYRTDVNGIRTELRILFCDFVWVNIIIIIERKAKCTNRNVLAFHSINYEYIRSTYEHVINTICVKHFLCGHAKTVHLVVIVRCLQQLKLCADN